MKEEYLIQEGFVEAKGIMFYKIIRKGALVFEFIYNYKRDTLTIKQTINNEKHLIEMNWDNFKNTYESLRGDEQ